MNFGRALMILAAAVPGWAQYTGPAVLARGEAPAAMEAPHIRFRPFVEVSEVYDTGLANVGVNDRGQLGNAASFGTQLAWGVSGSHSWRHVRLGLEYHGGLTHFASQGGFDSMDHSLLLGVRDQLSRRTALNLRESAGLFTRDFGLLNLPQTVPFDPATTFIPTTDYFDNRTHYLSSHADLMYQKTARLSFDVGGDAFFTRRRSAALNGDNGYVAKADMQYRASRRTTVGANYSYMHFSYTRLAGATDVHGVSASYSVRLSRWLEFSGYGGAMRVESTFVQTTAVDPAIAALLGIRSLSQLVHTLTISPNFSARLSRTFHTGVAYVSGGRTILPGNGLFVTSYANTVMGGYSYTGLRRWSFAANADYMTADSVGLIAGTYNGAGAGVTVSRVIARNFHFVGSSTVRRYGSPDYANYNRTIYDSRIGIGYSPGEVPLRVW